MSPSVDRLDTLVDVRDVIECKTGYALIGLGTWLARSLLSRPRFQEHRVTVTSTFLSRCVVATVTSWRRYGGRV